MGSLIMQKAGEKKNSVNIAEFIRQKREEAGLTQKELGDRLELGDSGERSVRRWENGEHKPPASILEKIAALPGKAPFFDNNPHPEFTFIDLFAGIGGVRLPFQELKGRCVFTSEWDKYAQKTYAANFGHVPHGDITQIKASDIPDHDVLLAGFPCQAFSQAGLKQGFDDTRGTMFFEIQRILAEKRPKAFLLENVKQLRGHDKGRTLKVILEILRGEYSAKIPQNVPMSAEARRSLETRLNYHVDFRVLRAADFGVPQNRERVYIVGFDRDAFPDADFGSLFRWPEPTGEQTCLGNILLENKEVEDKYTISNKLWSGHKRRRKEHKIKGNGFGYSLFDHNSPYANTISARYYKDGSEILIDQSDIGKNPRKLTPRECARLQGFPPNFVVGAVSDVQSYKQFGNSVSVPVIGHIAKAMKATLDEAESLLLEPKSRKKKYG